MKLFYTYHQINSHSKRFIKTFTHLLGDSFNHSLYEELDDLQSYEYDLLLFGPIHLKLKTEVAEKFKKIVGIAWAWEVWLAAYEEKAYQKPLSENLDLFDGLVVDANYVTEVVQQISGKTLKNIFMIPWGLDVEKFQTLPSQESIKLRQELDLNDKVLFISTRPWEEKFGFDHLISIFKKLKNINSKFHLVLVNGGSLEKEIKNSLGDNATFVGKIDESQISLWLTLCDYYISSAPTDGTSLSLLEGMICGRRVIVDHFQSNRQWVDNSDEGCLIDFKDHDHAVNEIVDYVAAFPPAFQTSSRDKILKTANWAINAPQLVKFLSEI